MQGNILRRLEEDYRSLLAEHGLKEYDLDRFQPESLRRAHNRVVEQERKHNSDCDVAEMESIYTDMETDLKAGLSLFRRLVQVFSEELETEIVRRWPAFSKPVLVREFPTGEFNAAACRVPSGILILLNEGLFMLIYHVLMILGYSFSMTKEDHVRLGDAEIDDKLAFVALHYLDTGNALFASQVLPLGGPKGGLVAEVRRECEKFTMAHEYGHAIAGHLDRGNGGRIESSAGYLKVIRKSWNEEFEADLIALRLIMSDIEDLNDESAIRRSLRIKISGVFFFFALANFLDKVDSARRGAPQDFSGSVTHPPPLDRLNRLMNVLGRDHEPDFVYSSGLFNALLEPRGERIADAIRRHSARSL